MSLRRMSYPLVTLAATTYAVAGAANVLTPTAVATGDLQGLTTGDIPVGQLSALALDFTISALSGAAATVTVTIDRKGSDGVYYNIYSSGALNATGATSADISPDGSATNKGFGQIIRVTVTISNTVTPSATMTLSLIGKS